MKEENKLNELMDTWSNTEKAIAIQLLKSSMAENAEKERIPAAVVVNYVKNAIKECLSTGRLLDYPDDFGSTSRSVYYKNPIQSAVKEVETELEIDTTTIALNEAWDNVKKSKTLIEVRKHISMYKKIVDISTYTEQDIQELTDMIDELDRENRKLLEYKRIHEELFGVMTSDDADLHNFIKSKKMKEMGCTDVEICKVLNISRDKLNYLRKKVVMQESESV